MKKELPNENLQGIMKMFLLAIENLAANAKEQIDYLGKLGTGICADELALELDDVIGVLPELVRNRFIDSDTFKLAGDLNKELDRISGEENEHLWTIDALRNYEEWKKIREMAKEVQKSLKSGRNP